MNQLIKLSITDFRLILRDPSLKFFLIAPSAPILMATLFLPYLVITFEGVNNYVPLALTLLAIQAATAFSFIYAMVFIDEKDKEVSKVYGVLPVSQFWFVLSRLTIPFVFTTLVTELLLLLQPFYDFSIISGLTISLLMGLISPIMTLSVSMVSKNKMEGMTWYKLVNLLVFIPFIAFFVPSLSVLFGIIPSHWVFQALNNLIANESYGTEAVIGFAYTSLWIILLTRRFVSRHFT